MLALLTENTWLLVVDAAINLAFAIVALTPTDKDDNIVHRIANVWNVLRGRSGGQ